MFSFNCFCTYFVNFLIIDLLNRHRLNKTDHVKCFLFVGKHTNDNFFESEEGSKQYEEQKQTEKIRDTS